MSPPMLELLRWTLLGLYFGTLGLLTLYGAHRWYLIGIYWRHRHRRARPAGRLSPLPRITVQLPLYNEMYVADRLINAVCRLDYPRERLEIQVLDDSTDETTARVATLVRDYRRRGLDIHHLRRDNRRGFKAGALAEGLRAARGELIAVFDADFVPPPEFLQRLVHHFSDPRVGMVQARWGHLNPGHSALTRVQSMFLDGHFVIEHTARHRSGRFFNFNGTAGIWRKRCILEAGGWQHDTLTEDLDLSYRAQLRGWRFIYLPDEVAPAELPVEMAAFKSQQHRWAKGSIQTAFKLLPRIWRASLPARVKLEATVHLTANVGYLLMLGLAMLVVPAVWLRSGATAWTILVLDLPLFTLSTLSVTAFYLVAQRESLGVWRGITRWVPFLMALGIGLSVNNARAVLEAWRGKVSGFRRTPKYNLARGESPLGRRYRGRVNRDTWIELGLGLYFAVATGAALASGLWSASPFLLLFAVGYAYTSMVTLRQSGALSRVSRNAVQRRSWKSRQTTADS